MNDDLILDMWDFIKELVDKKTVGSVAEKYVDILLEHGILEQSLKTAIGHDHDLDDAISYYLDDDEDDSED